MLLEMTSFINAEASICMQHDPVAAAGGGASKSGRKVPIKFL